MSLLSSLLTAVFGPGTWPKTGGFVCQACGRWVISRVESPEGGAEVLQDCACGKRAWL